MALLVGATVCGCAPGDAGDPGADARDPDDGEPAVICAASNGGPGGDGGSVLVLLGDDADAAQALAERLEDFVDAGPGAGGLGGLGDLGPDAVDGEPGAADDALVVIGRPEWSFDASAIDPEWVIDVSENEGTLTLPELSDPPDVVVSELHVRSGSSLLLSCDARITAERIVVEAGATLGFRSRNRSGCAWTFGGNVPDPGARGGVAWLETRSLELHGTLDLSGTGGTAGAPGGAGGSLTLRAETITLFDDAIIVVAGGTGGDGVAEMPCS